MCWSIRLSDARLRGVVLRRAVLEGVDFSGADLGGLKIADAGRFRGAVVSRKQAAELVAQLGLVVA